MGLVFHFGSRRDELAKRMGKAGFRNDDCVGGVNPPLFSVSFIWFLFY